MDKVVRDGLVAVVYHPSWGCGWYSWHGRAQLLFDPKIVAYIESGDTLGLEKYLEGIRGDDYWISAELEELAIEWIREGTEFTVVEYDGSETIWYKDSVKWIKA